MFQKAEVRAFFQKARALRANPYIGFTSFQHFRGDEIYSDIVVDPANHALETEERECYPVPDSTAHEGYREGYYPDCEIAYIRILWKEFEPLRHQYRFELIDDILRKARENRQTLMFRLMPHSTRSRDDVPDWLKDLVDCPQRPDGKRVKDSPADPVYLRYFGEAIEQIARRYDDDPVFDTIDISITGAWGEGHGVDRYPKEALCELMDVYTNSFRKTKLVGQVAAPWLIHYGLETAPVGWRGDGLGEKIHTYDVYPRVERQLSEVWKKAPVSFECYWWLGEWERNGWDLDDVIERSLRWHISSFNGKSMPIPFKWKDKIDAWIGKMGYHFSLRFLKYPKSGNPGDTLQLIMNMENTGAAPIYNRIPLKIKLTGEATEYVFDTEVDIRNWLPGDNFEDIRITLPDDMTPGSYDICIGVLGEELPTIYLESDVPFKDGFYHFVKIMIGAAC